MQDKVLKYSVLFIALVLGAHVLQTLGQVLRPLAIALLLLFVFTPLARYSKEKGIPAWLTFSGVLVVVVLLLSFAGSFLHVDDIHLQDKIPQLQERIRSDGDGLLATALRLGLDQSFTPEKLSKLATATASLGLAAVRTLISESLLALILLMFLVQSRAPLVSAVERKYGATGVENLEAIVRKIEGDVVAYLGTKTAISFGTAVVSGGVLFLFSAKAIVLTSLLIFLLNYIPIIGSLIAVLIAFVVYVVSFGLTATAGWMLLAMMAVQILFGSILEPKIAGKQLNMSPILIVVSLYVWGWIWGITGMLLSVPLTIFILVAVKHVAGTEKNEKLTVNSEKLKVND